eukprot:4887665-Amphidinium_carterae.1
MTQRLQAAVQITATYTNTSVEESENLMMRTCDKAYAEEMNILFMETSAKDGQNVRSTAHRLLTWYHND